MIKSVKKSLKISIGEQALTFSEMQTALFEVASLVNERPIGRPQHHRMKEPICPQMIFC